MALTAGGASRLGTHAGRSFSGSLTIPLGGGMGQRRENYDLTGAHRNWCSGWHSITDVTKRSGLPNGYRSGYAWMLAQESGAITSLRHTPVITIDGAANGAMGVNGEANATISINGSGTGGLIAGGVATATISLSGTATGFLGLNGAATATISLSGSGTPAAIGHAAAAGTISIDGSIVSYAVGFMEANSDFGNEFSPSNLARAVWDALAADYNDSGTMGAKMNAAGTAGDPWTALESAYTTPGQMGYVVAQVIQKIMRNKSVTDPVTGVMTVYDDDGSTVFLQADVFEDTAGATPYQGSGADRRDRLE